MPDTAEFQELIANLRNFCTAEYQRGGRDAIARIMRAAQQPGGSCQPEVSAPSRVRVEPTQHQKEIRAPKGAAEALVRRVLTSAGSEGVAASDISALAKTDAEQLVSNSTIRLMLSKGRERDLYQNIGGKWFLKGMEGKN